MRSHPSTTLVGVGMIGSGFDNALFPDQVSGPRRWGWLGVVVVELGVMSFRCNLPLPDTTLAGVVGVEQLSWATLSILFML